MDFEWDGNKAAVNLRKHRVSFEDAARVFLDPRRIEAFDGRDVTAKIVGKPWVWLNPHCWLWCTRSAATTARTSD